MLGPLLTFLVANTIGMVSPGPDTVLIVRLAGRSRHQALAAALGIVTGATFWTALTVAGMAQVLQRFPDLLGVLQLLGGCYLMYMGASIARAGWRARRNSPHIPEAAVAPVKVRRAYLTGLATNLSNPKIVLFMAAVLSQFLPVGASLGVHLIYIGAVSLSALLWFTTLAFVLSTRRVSRAMLGLSPQIDMVSGAVFVLIGLSVAIPGLRELLEGVGV
ncbi:Threonine efflux protein [Corynebacterium ciconiae DSM 44920]|uniref:LysE family translocator n=1 Tax=Corynebacterium ciconiae TaxID=227319 RepID=UPI000372BA5B|nr:LysE family translocator [Corynebacterium ciconiae]WKD61713.1 Threonine efflux protein [Corynebacterium ciconiae DSM 44920]